MGRWAKDGRWVKNRKEKLPPCSFSPHTVVRTAHPLSEDQKQVKGFQGGRTNRPYAVIATGPMNDAVYDSPILIDRSTN